MSQDDAVVRAQHIDKMGPSLGPVYNELSDELMWLHVQWLLHRQLYGTSAERHEVLNRTAPFFFYLIRRTLWEDILLRIARLTDPPKSPGKGNRDNLSLCLLPGLEIDASFRTEIEASLSDALAASGFARSWRNQRLAHRDLALALSEDVELLPAPEVPEVEVALQALSAVLNRVASLYAEPPVVYGLVQFDGGVDSLVYYLRTGLRAKHGNAGQKP